MTEYMAGARPPMGYEDACEPNPDGWPVWTKRDDGKPPCGNDDCVEPYNVIAAMMTAQINSSLKTR